MIYLVRHGQTEFNLIGRMQGALDSPLTALGRDQARRLGQLLAGLTADEGDWTLVASPQGRAQATADVIHDEMGGRLPRETDGRLREISLGSWDGLTLEDIEMAYPGALDGLDRYGWQFKSPDGETYEAISARLADWLGEAQASGRRLIVVSHGIAGLILRGLYGGQERDVAMRAGAPQDAVFLLAGGVVSRIDAAQAEG
jgi:probable phosphoglycerate mutase